MGATISDGDDDGSGSVLDLQASAERVMPGGTGKSVWVERFAIGHEFTAMFLAVPGGDISGQDDGEQDDQEKSMS